MSSNNSSSHYSIFPTAEDSDDKDVQEYKIRLLIRGFFIITMLVTVAGNLLVIGAISISKKLQSSKNNWLLCNLAVADLLQGAIAVPLRITETIPSFTNNLSCRIGIPMSILFGGTSNITILFISFERFLSIYYPFLHFHYFTSNLVRSLIGFSWGTVGFFSLISASNLCWNKQEHSKHTSFCRFPVYLKKEYIWSLYTYVHIIPVSLIIILYGFILKASCEQTRRIHQQNVAVCMNRFSRSGKLTIKTNSNFSLYLKTLKGVKVVSVVVGIFIVLVLPIIVIDVIDVLDGTRPSPDIVQLAVCMIYANNCVNVFVYAGFNKDYRDTFKKILKRLFCCFNRF